MRTILLAIGGAAFIYFGSRLHMAAGAFRELSAAPQEQLSRYMGDFLCVASLSCLYYLGKASQK